MRADIQLEGLAALDEQLRQLPSAAQQRVVRPAMRAGARFIARAVRQGAPVRQERHPKYGRGGLRRSVAVTQTRDAGEYNVAFRVGFRRARGTGGETLLEGRGIGGRSAHLNQFGTGPRVTRKGANRGRMPANPFFTRAIEAGAQGAALTLRATFADRLAREARRLRLGQLDARGRVLPQFRRTRGRA